MGDGRVEARLLENYSHIYIPRSDPRTYEYLRPVNACLSAEGARVLEFLLGHLWSPSSL